MTARWWQAMYDRIMFMLRKAGCRPSELAKTRAFLVGTQVERRGFLVRTMALGSLGTPKLGHSRLIVRVLFKAFAEDHHRLAAEIDTARSINRIFIGHVQIPNKASFVIRHWSFVIGRQGHRPSRMTNDR